MKPLEASYPLPSTRKGDSYPLIPSRPVPSRMHRLHRQPGSWLSWRVARGCEYLDDALTA